MGVKCWDACTVGGCKTKQQHKPREVESEIVAARTKNPTCSCAQWQLFSIELHRLLAPPPYANLSPNNEVDELIKYVHRGRIRQYFCEYEDLQKNEHNLAEENKQNAMRAES